MASVPALLLVSVLVASEHAISAGTADELVEIRDVAYETGTISGVVVNRASDELRDVKLRIRASWRSNDEKRSGVDATGWWSEHTVPEIAPHDSKGFRYRPPEPPTAPSDGRYELEVTVVGVTRRRVEVK